MSIDPLAIFGAIGGAQLVVKVLGPSAEYLGTNLKELMEKRQKNTKRILENAEKKLGDKANKEGQVSPRVIKEVLDEGSFREDDIGIEYFGGVLASSRTDSNRDDRGIVMMKLISSLSTYQLQTHYMIYKSIKSLLDGFSINFGTGNERRKARVFIPLSSYMGGIGITGYEAEKFDTILSHSMVGLSRESLLEGYEYSYTVEGFNLNDSIKNSIDEGGLLVVPSALGVELFLSANGLADLHPIRLLDKSTIIRPLEGVNFDMTKCKIL
jgi:hypothetical protein